jgi:hypothetical protein
MKCKTGYINLGYIILVLFLHHNGKDWSWFFLLVKFHWSEISEMALPDLSIG